MSKDKTPPEPEEQTPESIEQVRDILFGAQMRTVDRRLAQLEQRFQRDLEDQNRELTKRLETQESWARKQVSSLEEKIKAERSKRTDDLKALSTEMKAGFRDLDKRLSSLDDATAKSDAELRDQILALTKTVSDDLRALGDRLTADIDRYVAELRFEKTDTASLVELFTDVARRLGESLETDKA
jgi:DNA anti-recombination protein RmuC